MTKQKCEVQHRAQEQAKSLGVGVNDGPRQHLVYPPKVDGVPIRQPDYQHKYKL